MIEVIGAEAGINLAQVWDMIRYFSGVSAINCSHLRSESRCGLLWTAIAYVAVAAAATVAPPVAAADAVWVVRDCGAFVAVAAAMLHRQHRLWHLWRSPRTPIRCACVDSAKEKCKKYFCIIYVLICMCVCVSVLFYLLCKFVERFNDTWLCQLKQNFVYPSYLFKIMYNMENPHGLKIIISNT